nr:Ig-like domain-containing protein [Lachnospiraceae bacterium]
DGDTDLPTDPSKAAYASAVTADTGVLVSSGQTLAVKAVKPGIVKLTGITTDGSRKKVECTVKVRGQVTGLALKTSKGKKGVNDATLSDDSAPGSMKYTGNMKAKSSMKLTPVVDINEVSGTSNVKADKNLYKTFRKHTDTSVSYRSSDISVATVDKKGKITVRKGIEAGKTVTIYAASADGEYKAEITITVVN